MVAEPLTPDTIDPGMVAEPLTPDTIDPAAILGGTRDVRSGLGEEWDWDVEPPLIGKYLGETSQTVEREDKETHETVNVEQSVYQFEPLYPGYADSMPVVFVWGAYVLDQAMHDETAPRVGDAVRITYLGKHDVKGKAQVIRRYRVEVFDAPAETVRAALAAATAQAPEPMAGERLSGARRNRRG